MPELESRFIARWSAAAFARTGVIVMLLGAAPLLLYSVFGPADGNPLRLAMLAAVLVPTGFLLLGIGGLKWFIGKTQQR